MRMIAALPENKEIKIFPDQLTAKQLKYLPKRLRQMAEEIKALNNHKYFLPEEWTYDAGKHRPIVSTIIQRDFKVLPGILEQYADSLEFRTNQLYEYRKGRGKAGSVKRDLIRVLMNYVRQTTGKPHYEALAELPSAALADDAIYTAEALRQLDARRTSRVAEDRKKDLQ